MKIRIPVEQFEHYGINQHLIRLVADGEFG
jgi:hypothetical protein